MTDTTESLTAPDTPVPAGLVAIVKARLSEMSSEVTCARHQATEEDLVEAGAMWRARTSRLADGILQALMEKAEAGAAVLTKTALRGSMSLEAAEALRVDPDVSEQTRHNIEVYLNELPRWAAAQSTDGRDPQAVARDRATAEEQHGYHMLAMHSALQELGYRL